MLTKKGKNKAGTKSFSVGVPFFCQKNIGGTMSWYGRADWLPSLCSPLCANLTSMSTSCATLRKPKLYAKFSIFENRDVAHDVVREVAHDFGSILSVFFERGGN